MHDIDPNDDTFTAALLRAALGEAIRDERDDDDYDTSVKLVADRDADEVLELAQPLADHADPRVRALVADVVGGLFRFEDRPEPGDFTELLAGMLAEEDTSLVLTRLGIALGNVGHPTCGELMTPFARHPDPSVRSAVVEALMAQQGFASVDALIGLSRDIDEKVRREATFALASQHESTSEGEVRSPLIDTPILREALAARLDDPHDANREEAFQGLVRRRDPRVVPQILTELERGPEDEQVFTNARLVGSPLLYDALVKLEKTKDRAKRRFWESLGLEAAVVACMPPRQPKAPVPPIESPAGSDLLEDELDPALHYGTW